MAETHQRNRGACSQNHIVGCVCGAQIDDFLLLKEAVAIAVCALQTTLWVMWGVQVGEFLVERTDQSHGSVCYQNSIVGCVWVQMCEFVVESKQMQL